MTGPEHYREAERLAERAETWRDFDRWPMTSEERIAAQVADATAAQAHATLALVAAQVSMAHVSDMLVPVHAAAWRAVGVVWE